MSNPLLSLEVLPQFDQIQSQHVAPAISELLIQARAALQQVTQPDYPTEWAALSAVLDTATERLSRAWGTVGHLVAVADSAALRDAYNHCLPQVSAFWSELGSSDALYEKYRHIATDTINPEQRRAHTLLIENFVRSGAELQGQSKERFNWIQTREAELSQKFSENTLDATDAFALYVIADDLAGVPQDAQQAARAAAASEGRDDYKLSLRMPCYQPIMRFAHRRELREQLHRAYTTRASDQGPAEYDNTAVIRELLALRHEQAQLLGYPHFAALSLANKMARSSDEVLRFLRDLARCARPFAERELAEMRSFAAEQLNLKDPQAWDWPYVAERLKEQRYAFSAEEVRAYFPASQVLSGLFKIVEQLFNLRIQQDQAPVWHPSVHFYRIERAACQDSGTRLLGQFYLDQPARAGKRAGAWMDGVHSRWLRPDNAQLQTPLAHLVCNFPDALAGRPALLSHEDVITLFHEFGHGLHHLLTQVNEREVSGINGVEWDAVELPSQFMENFCWEWSALQQLSRHPDTGASLSRTLFDKMSAAKNFQVGLQTLRQVEFALFDMLLHAQPQAQTDPMPLLGAVRSEVALLPAPPYSRPAHSFSHIFAGGYAAGYYSYQWAEVLSADAYAAFEEAAAVASPEAQIRICANRYCQEILQAGGSRPALESFVAFRGREPELGAWLRHQGMDVDQARSR